jgi:hypothetical protein
MRILKPSRVARSSSTIATFIGLFDSIAIRKRLAPDTSAMRWTKQEHTYAPVKAL